MSNRKNIPVLEIISWIIITVSLFVVGDNTKYLQAGKLTVDELVGEYIAEYTDLDGKQGIYTFDIAEYSSRRPAVYVKRMYGCYPCEEVNPINFRYIDDDSGEIVYHNHDSTSLLFSFYDDTAFMVQRETTLAHSFNFYLNKIDDSHIELCRNWLKEDEKASEHENDLFYLTPTYSEPVVLTRLDSAEGQEMYYRYNGDGTELFSRSLSKTIGDVCVVSEHSPNTVVWHDKEYTNGFTVLNANENLTKIVYPPSQSYIKYLFEQGEQFSRLSFEYDCEEISGLSVLGCYSNNILTYNCQCLSDDGLTMVYDIEGYDGIIINYTSLERETCPDFIIYNGRLE